MATAFNEGLLAAGATDGPFLATFGEDVVRYPLGVEANKETVTALVDREHEFAQKSQGGELRSNHRRNTDKEQIGRILLLEIAEVQAFDLKDKWDIDGVLWKVTRVYGKDAGMTTLVLENRVPLRTSRGGRTE